MTDSAPDNYLELWDRAAREYEEQQKTESSLSYLRKYIDENYADMSGMKVLDLACGSGNYDDLFIMKGAHVYACDASKRMLSLVKAKQPECVLDLCDICRTLPYPDSFFELIFCNMAMMDVLDFTAAICEASRVLQKSGSFFFSIVHPMLYTGEWVHDGSGRKTSYRVENYLSRCSAMNNYWGTTVHFHRPISFYINESLKAGLTLLGMEEVCIAADETSPDPHGRPAGVPTLALFEFCKD